MDRIELLELVAGESQVPFRLVPSAQEPHDLGPPDAADTGEPDDGLTIAPPCRGIRPLARSPVVRQVPADVDDVAENRGGGVPAELASDRCRGHPFEERHPSSTTPRSTSTIPRTLRPREQVAILEPSAISTPRSTCPRRARTRPIPCQTPMREREVAMAGASGSSSSTRSARVNQPIATEPSSLADTRGGASGLGTPPRMTLLAPRGSRTPVREPRSTLPTVRSTTRPWRDARDRPVRAGLRSPPRCKPRTRRARHAGVRRRATLQGRGGRRVGHGSILRRVVARGKRVRSATMDFDLTDEQRQFREVVRDFAQEVVAPGAAERDEREEFPLEVVTRMAELGLFGLPFSETFGGAGGDAVTMCLVLEELGRCDRRCDHAGRGRRARREPARPLRTDGAEASGISWDRSRRGDRLVRVHRAGGW